MQESPCPLSPVNLQTLTSYLDTLSEKAAKYFKQNPEAAQILEPKPPSLSATEIASHLADKPHLQEQLAALVDYSPSRWLLSREIRLLRERRAIHDVPRTDFCPEQGDAYEWAMKNKLYGICLSGGGIRSATFNLGILQGLAKHTHLNRFDYLSSVSGGGYIHEWFAAWVKREEQKQKDQAAHANPPEEYVPGSGFREVEKRLKPLPSTKDCPIHPDPITWLRRYSNYLTPRKGLLTADAWVSFVIWVRNTFLNQLILVSGLFFMLLLPYGIGKHLLSLPLIVSRYIPAVAFLLAVVVIARVLHEEDKRNSPKHLTEDRGTEPSRRWGGEKTVLALVVLPLLLACVLHLRAAFETGRGQAVTDERVGVFVLLWLLGAAAATAGGSLKAYKALNVIAVRQDDPWWRRSRQKIWIVANGIGGLVIANAAFSAFAGTLLFQGVCVLLAWNHSWWSPSAHLGGVDAWRLRATFGPPLLLIVPFFTLVIGAGLLGRDFPDWLREWLARVRGLALLAGLGWSLFFGIALLGPYVVHVLTTPARLSAVIAWLGTTAASVLAGKSNKTSGNPTEGIASNIRLDVLAKLGAYVSVLGLLLALSLAAKWALDGACSSSHPGLMCLLVSVTPLGIFGLFGWRVDVNEFSMNPFYRNRLTRCYLGASNRRRSPNPVTGFDDCDTWGMQISHLTPQDGYTGPFPIVCTAINLSFGQDLAWQERKAASFAFTPVCTGYDVGWTAGKPGSALNFCGFVPTADYAVPGGGINMATAVAISGAAASPNSGFHTHPITAFLMTVFNVRMGWWLPNTRRPGKLDRVSPRFAPLELTKEMLGMADDTAKFVYLSDDGHFDNMGLYELVRRRCYRIVICDAEQDENYFFEGIGNAIRKCRIDFGAEITLDINKLRPVESTGNCQSHWATGTIRYPETPAGHEHEGKILYIKSSLTGPLKYALTAGKDLDLPSEPVDIINYKFTHPHFPHDTTADQWFTESQFESYRRLGYHVVDEVKLCDGWPDF